MAANKFLVPKRAWSKWSDLERGTFNRLFEGLKSAQHILAPGTDAMSKRAWRVLAWNAAWLAANATGAALKSIADTGTA